MSDQEESPELKLVRRAAEQLSEHFDSVQIFVLRHEPEAKPSATRHIAFGLGNWFARFGQIVQWVEKGREDAREELREENRQ